MTVEVPEILQYLIGPGTSWRDVARALLDVAVVGFILHRALLLIRGTRGIQVLVGLLLVGLGYLASQWANLATLNWLLGHFLTYAFLFIIVLFQADLRRGLASLGRSRLLAALAPEERRAQAETIEAVTRAVLDLARRRRGALVVLERAADLEEVVATGVRLDAVVSEELLLALFHPGGALHDGAVVVRRGRAAAASCLLPLTAEPQARELGTRHRAALGLAEEVDAVVVVVSEERGEISLAVDGELHRGLDESRLRATLARLLLPARGAAHPAPPPGTGRRAPRGPDEPEGDRAAV